MLSGACVPVSCHRAELGPGGGPGHSPCQLDVPQRPFLELSGCESQLHAGSPGEREKLSTPETTPESQMQLA